VFDAATADGVLRLHQPDVRWLSTGWAGGFERADAAYNITVPEGWSRTDIGTYIDERRERADFDSNGPTLLTGVEQQHVRGARLDPVVAYATVGLSNPAVLPMETAEADQQPDQPPHRGTVNIMVGTTRRLDRATLVSLLGTVVEAKTATLLPTTGFSGTTSDAAIVGTHTAGEPAAFAGSATEVGAAARACTREAIRASLRSRYAEREILESVGDAEYGVVTDRRAAVFEV
jgi:adenosylcobinamide hydrolase